MVEFEHLFVLQNGCMYFVWYLVFFTSWITLTPWGHSGSPWGHPGSPWGYRGPPGGHPGLLWGHPGSPRGHGWKLDIFEYSIGCDTENLIRIREGKSDSLRALLTVREWVSNSVKMQFIEADLSFSHPKSCHGVKFCVQCENNFGFRPHTRWRHEVNFCVQCERNILLSAPHRAAPVGVLTFEPKTVWE